MPKASCLIGFFVLTLTASARAYLFMPASVADALTKANAWVKDHPTQGDGYFFLARVNGSAWAKGTTGKNTEVQIASFGDAKNAPFFVPWDSLMYQRNAELEVTAESKAYLRASLLNYRKAVELDAKNPLYQLGLAWALEQAATCRLELPPEFAGTAALTPEQSKQFDAAMAQLGAADFAVRDKAAKSLAALMPTDGKALLATKSEDLEVTAHIDAIIRDYWLAQAVAHYRQAYSLAVKDDLKAEQFRDEADHTLSVVAGKRLLTLLPAQPDVKPQELDDIRDSLALINAKPREMIFY